LYVARKLDRRGSSLRLILGSNTITFIGNLRIDY